MNLTPVNLVTQNTNLYNTKNSPAFKAKLKITKGAMRYIKEELPFCLEFNDDPSLIKKYQNPKKFVDGLKSAFQKATKNIPGTVKFTSDSAHEYLTLGYKYDDGKEIHSSNHFLVLLVPNVENKKGENFRDAVRYMVADLSEATARQTDKKYTKNNLFMAAYNRLYKNSIKKYEAVREFKRILDGKKLAMDEFSGFFQKNNIQYID